MFDKENVPDELLPGFQDKVTVLFKNVPHEIDPTEGDTLMKSPALT
jgi:hypothetical protein